MAQTAAGFLVDHTGARRVLLAGMTLVAGAIALAAATPSYWVLLIVAAVAGLGNSVFHPADYSILNASVSAPRVARAYSIHSISGNLGWVLAPLVVGTVTALAGWRAALLVAGGLGLVATAVIAANTRGLGGAEAARGSARPDLRGQMSVLMAAPILMAFAYFALLTTSTTGIQTFSVPALGAIYHAPLTLATGLSPCTSWETRRASWPEGCSPTGWRVTTWWPRAVSSARPLSWCCSPPDTCPSR